MSERALPNSVETEQTLLGCVINDTSKFIEVDDLLSESDFYLNRHKKIYRAIKELINKGDQVDLITLIEHLKTKNELSECGGPSYLTELSTSAVIYSNTLNYADIIKEKAKRRILIKAGQILSAKGFDDDVNVLVEETENKLFEVMNSNKKDIISIQDAIENTFISLEERFKNKNSLKGISTGFTEIDELSSGLNRSDFIVIAARPSMGKTAFALNIGQAASQFGSVAVFSIEMSTDQLMDRLLAARCLIDYGNIKQGNLNDEEFNKIIQESTVLKNRKMFIDDESRLINDIKAKCRKLKIQKGLDVVIIDYLQLITTTQKTNSREQEVSYISKELKALAKELNITVIALSQLSRAPEQRADHRPILSDLRESGSIEQDADIIHFLYRDEYYNKETEDKNIAEVITAKNRNGVTRTTKLAWLGQYQRFGSLDVIHG
ncbi:Replicative DNA helicase [Clostridium neonatale]|uniref:replicative DNA helicase n=1 Tax=Clostridium neonatale TaxID=137838 RepID=UPI00291B616B|nr:replicative DNA helicase [Clostridium neonatale]CAI3698954.1 Replicative DNA helicase [Clostridium neonatale]